MEEQVNILSFYKDVEESDKLIFEIERLRTFDENWKDLKGFKHCTSKNFAAAGFYNCSTSKCPDNVKCFACQKELSDWEKNDDPWMEHLKRGEKCPFVIYRNKGTSTLGDFLRLQFEVKKNILNNYFEHQKNIVKDKEKVLLKILTNANKNKK